ncbi:response regulator [Polycladidibacter stylochi]|uniref:response regulator n=1 Tax=Polycladidibacter stylochi TaxID=1807766 RepID=UPI000834A608|nr:response regulator [Pseudovibrio stylochi]
MNHFALGKTTNELDIVVIEDSKPVQSILRSLLSSLEVRRIRIFDGPKDAIPAMASELPDIILTDWVMSPLSGLQMLNLIRQPQLAPLCFVPVIVITAHGTRENVNRAMQAGAHHILVKPISASQLEKCLLKICRDTREMVIGAEGIFQLAGIAERLELSEKKYNDIQNAEKIRSVLSVRDKESDINAGGNRQFNRAFEAKYEKSELQNPRAKLLRERKRVSKQVNSIKIDWEEVLEADHSQHQHKHYGYTKGYMQGRDDVRRSPLKPAFGVRKQKK